MIRWLSEVVGTAPYGDPAVQDVDGTVIDVRELGDRPGNDLEALRRFIGEVAAALGTGQRVVVCCDMGISRSNAVAIGAMVATGTPFDEALAAYVASGPEAEIDAHLLRDVRSVVEPRPDEDAGAGAILLLGHGGYLGSRLVARLADRKVVTLDREQQDVVRDVLLLDGLLRREGVDTVVHLAHPRRHNSLTTMGQAVALTRAVIELCRLNRCRLVYPSSLTVFAGLEGDHTVTAATPPAPRGVHAETKLLCEQLIEVHRGQGLDAVVARIGGMYGPGMARTSFLAKFFEWAAGGEVITTHRYRNGDPAFDLVFVDDVVDALEGLVRGRHEGVVHVGTGQVTSTADLAAMVTRLVGSASPHRYLAIDDTTARIRVDPDETEAATGWRPSVGLDVGLRRTWESIRPQLVEEGA